MGSRHISCDSCAVRNRAVCGALSDDEISRLNAIARFKQFPAGSVILRDHDEPAYFANVVAGVVKLTKTLTDGRQQIVALLFPGDFLGRPYRAEFPYTAETATEVQLCCYGRAYFEGFMQEQSDLKQIFLERTLDSVDAVVIFDEVTPLALITLLQPDVLVKGADWKAEEIVGRDVVESRGGRVVRITFSDGHSTSELIRRASR